MPLLGGGKKAKRVRTLPKEEVKALQTLGKETGLEHWKRQGGWEALETAERVEGIEFIIGADGVSRVQSIDLSYNNLVGRLPEELGLLSQLEKLIVYGNMIIGTIPIGLCHLEKLSVLMVQRNKLIGKVPAALQFREGLNLQFDGTWRGITPYVEDIK